MKRSLIAELNAVFNDILIRSGAAGAVALNSGSIQTDSRLFQAKFNTGDWSGELQAFDIDADTGAIGASVWDAGEQVNCAELGHGAHDPVVEPGRRIAAIAFRWPAVPASPDRSPS